MYRAGEVSVHRACCERAVIAIYFCGRGINSSVSERAGRPPYKANFHIVRFQGVRTQIKLLSQWRKIHYVVVFPTTRNRHFPEKNILAGNHSRFPRWGGGDCYPAIRDPSGRQYHYIATFPIVRFRGGGGGGKGENGDIRLHIGFSYREPGIDLIYFRKCLPVECKLKCAFVFAHPVENMSTYTYRPYAIVKNPLERPIQLTFQYIRT